MKRKTAFLATLALLVTVSAGLSAERGGQRGDRAQNFIRKFDTDGDGKVTKEEMGDKARHFDRLDQNQDGSVTKEEASAHFQRKGQRGGEWGGRDRDRQRGERQNREGQNRRFKPPIMEKLDKNGDGKITKEEWTAAFNEMDKDGDGALTVRELMARAPGQGGPDYSRMLARFDKNKDKKISLDEFVDERFGQADRNGDGAMTKEEYKASIRQMVQGRSRRQDGPRGRQDRPIGPQAGRPPAGGPQGGGPNADLMEHVADMAFQNDKNNDGKLSRDEASAIYKRLFDRMDRNRDGFLSTADAGGQQRDRGNRDRRNRPGNKDRSEMINRMISRGDKDKDGMLSRDEAPGRIKERFVEIDTNDDGFISQDELKASFGDRNAKARQDAPKYITENDVNGDKKLDREEFPGDKSMFETIDKNKDGFITADEILEARGARR